MDNDGQFTSFGKFRDRVSQRGIQPTAVKPTQIASTSMVNTNAEILGPISLADGLGISLKSLLTNNRNPNYRLGAVPYGVVFFEDDLNIGSIIGDGVTGYTINGPMSMPQFTPYAFFESGNLTLGGSTGNNLVFLTEIINNTGMTHDIYIITDCRIYLPTGGGVLSQ